MKIHIDCECGCTVFSIERWSDKTYSFNMYMLSKKSGFFRRIKWALEYFKRGEFAYNDIVIEESNIDKIIKFLKEAKESKEE